MTLNYLLEDFTFQQCVKAEMLQKQFFLKFTATEINCSKFKTILLSHINVIDFFLLRAWFFFGNCPNFKCLTPPQLIATMLLLSFDTLVRLTVLMHNCVHRLLL